MNVAFDPTLSLGALADWVSGIATAVAVILTLFYSQRQARREDEERLHALYAWAEQADGANPPKWTIEIRNDTHYPIYEWSIRAAAEDGRDLLANKGPLDNLTAGLLTPGRTHFGWVPPAWFSAGESGVLVAVRFKDARGVSLTRSPTGQLLKGWRG